MSAATPRMAVCAKVCGEDLVRALRALPLFVRSGEGRPLGSLHIRFTPDGLAVSALGEFTMAQALVPYVGEGGVESPRGSGCLLGWVVVSVADVASLSHSVGTGRGPVLVELRRTDALGKGRMRLAMAREGEAPGRGVVARVGVDGARGEELLREAVAPGSSAGGVASLSVTVEALAWVADVRAALGGSTVVEFFVRDGRVVFVADGWLVGLFLEARGEMSAEQSWSVTRRVGLASG